MKTTSGGSACAAASKRMPRASAVDVPLRSSFALMSIQYADATPFMASSVAATAASSVVAMDPSRFAASVGFT